MKYLHKTFNFAPLWAGVESISFRHLTDFVRVKYTNGVFPRISQVQTNCFESAVALPENTETQKQSKQTNNGKRKTKEKKEKVKVRQR